eukprot:SAG31_NODE_1390_length_8539_cov_12.684834_1_plen_80_part_00
MLILWTGPYGVPGGTFKFLIDPLGVRPWTARVTRYLGMHGQAPTLESSALLVAGYLGLALGLELGAATGLQHLATDYLA